jgi:hypothetical protein
MTIQTVDVTPTWQGILPVLLTLLQSENLQTRDIAESELRRMAGLADGYVEVQKAGLTYAE